MNAAKISITRRMDDALDRLQTEFSSLCDIRNFEYKLEALFKAGSKSNRSSILKELFDMFDACGIPYERGQSSEYYEELIRTSRIPTFSEIEDRMLYALYMRYSEYPTPEDYMRRMVDRLCSPEDRWNDGTLRLRILKQFIKYGDYLYDAGYRSKAFIIGYVKKKLGRSPSREEVLECLDDDIFDGLTAATKEQKKPDGKYGLIKIADDLAVGKFRAGGSTKKVLYFFAMVYGMTYYTGNARRAEILDYDTDIAVNLFSKYYSNNLMRFITDAYQGNISEYEMDPSGQGINYKNFAEMIYLYFICTDYAPHEKIRLSCEMAERVRKEQAGKGTPERKNNDTVFYRGIAAGQSRYSEDILSMDPEAFEEFIRTNYDCDTAADPAGVLGDLQLETEQNSAFREYKEIIKGITDRGGSLENCNYGLWFTDPGAFLRKGFENISDRRPNEIDREKFGEFMNLILRANSFMGVTFAEEESTLTEEKEKRKVSRIKTKALYVDDAKKVTRASVIVAYYYYYNLIHEDDDIRMRRSFREVFVDFKAGIDPRLEAAYYQPLSGRNLFDVLAVFSAYAYQTLG